MQVKAKSYDVGVIVGRFQTHELHAGHLGLIDHVRTQHEKVIIFLGNSPLWATANNPLDFQARSQMLREAYPDIIVNYIDDMNSDEKWSAKLDRQLASLVSPAQSVVLYGSRDSFIPHYEGRHDTRELESSQVFSGTAERKLIAAGNTKASADFRAGVIWAASARFPTAFTTVDIAIFDDAGERLLLGRKPDEDLFRFIGGFSDPGSDSFEADAKREVQEETGIAMGDLTYIGSRRVDDWRYRSEQDCIKTMLFVGKRIYGAPKPDDDIAEVRWFDWNRIKGIDVMEAHRPLLEMLAGHVEGLAS